MLLDAWNEAHKRDDADDDLEPPSPEWWQQQQDRIMADKRLTTSQAS